MMLLELNKGWQFNRVGEREKYPATVPGSVYADLIENGLIGDPYWRTNEKSLTDYSRNDYEYTCKFSLSPEIFESQEILLVCEGLDTVCDVYINNSPVLKSDNMHRIYKTDIKENVELKNNELKIIMNSPVKYIERMQKNNRLYNTSNALSGISHLRKAHFMSGWDWAPILPDMGIWRKIYIEAYENPRIDDVYVSQNHKKNKVGLDIMVDIENRLKKIVKIKGVIKGPEDEVFLCETETSDSRAHLKTCIHQPKIWWVNNLGDSPLYNVEISLFSEDGKNDEKKLRIGLRTVDVRRCKDDYGESFEIILNGKPIFAMGADYVPQDSIISRCSKERTEKLIRSCVKGNFNCLRVWGGAYYPEDYFFDMCDENGILVWQDFMFACGIYELTREFKETVVEEIKNNVRRIRNHACLALWCGNNEQEWGWIEWGWSENYSEKLKKDYLMLYEEIIPAILDEEDPDTFYWPSSPSSGGCFDDPNSQNRGDMHYWEVWHKTKDFNEYKKQFPRFMSEFGIQSYPSMKTIESFTLPGDRHMHSEVMLNHQKNKSGNDKILHYINDEHEISNNFDEIVYASQIVQAQGLETGVKHWRRNRDVCKGAVYWQLNDCWPVASWSSLDYYGRWKALHYAAKRFFEPVMVSADYDDGDVKITLVNDTMKKIYGEILWRFADNKSETIKSGKKKISLSPLTVSEYLKPEFNFDKASGDVYLEFEFVSGDDSLSYGTCIFTKHGKFNFLNPDIRTEIFEMNDRFLVEIKTKSYAKYVEVSFEGIDAVLSDNYFDVSANKVKTIELLKEDISGEYSLEKLKKNIKTRSVFDLQKK